MNILTAENKPFNTETLPDQLGDVYYGVLDNSNPFDVDYFFHPLAFLESFNSPAIQLRIGGKYKVKMPIDWQILIGDPEYGDLETVPLSSLNDRGFKAFQYNPISGFRPSFLDVEVVDVITDIGWFTPRLKNGQFLCVPIEWGDKPQCVYFVNKELTRGCEVVDFQQSF